MTSGNISRGHLGLRYLRYEIHWLISCSITTDLWLKIKSN